MKYCERKLISNEDICRALPHAVSIDFRMTREKKKKNAQRITKVLITFETLPLFLVYSFKEASTFARFVIRMMKARNKDITSHM